MNCACNQCFWCSCSTACALLSDHGYLLSQACFQALQSYSWGFALIQSPSNQCFFFFFVLCRHNKPVSVVKFKEVYLRTTCPTMITIRSRHLSKSYDPGCSYQISKWHIHTYSINIITNVIGATFDGGRYTTSHKLKRTSVFINNQAKLQKCQTSSQHQVYLNTCSKHSKRRRN